MFAYDRQVQTDPGNAAYYFECLQDLAIGRESAVLEEKVQILASEGQTNRKEVAKAYAYFGINPVHSAQLTDEIIVGQFRARLQDTSPASEDETRNMLRIIGQARQSSKILQEASNGERSILFGDMQQLTFTAIETYAQALSWLDISAETPDEFVQTMFAIKVCTCLGQFVSARPCNFPLRFIRINFIHLHHSSFHEVTLSSLIMKTFSVTSHTS